MSDSKNPSDSKKVNNEVQVMAAKGYEALNKAKELDEKYRVSERGRHLTQVAAERAGSAITNGHYFSASALWVSGALDKAVKCTAQLGNNRNRSESNSRKRK
eukprot:TRINITY_DN2969_c0_g1_i1.p1 TRINITY_DN2969_c0_g1~~TRINITY_DN2969_c0_g1_i1.p1  ORF type:complete len:102 (-),score=19.42 TRINITY_DN2969_c0_g1_i1:149-454(-)